MEKTKEKETLLFTLTPNKGFYKSNNEMAYLDGNIACYYPSNVGEPDGYVYFTFYPDGTKDESNVRLWSTTKGAQKLRADFSIETSGDETYDFFFFKPVGDVFEPIGNKTTITGAKTQVLSVNFNSDVNGDALIGLYATKVVIDGIVWILRKIEVHQL